MHGNWTYIMTMFVVTYLVRVLPLTIFRKPIENRFVKSFLYYVPYVTLSLMIFPAIVQVTQSPVAGWLALIAGIVAAMLGAGLLPVAAVCCAIVLAAEFIF